MSSVEALLNCCNNYILIDVGASITNKKFTRDVDSVIQRAKDAGKFRMLLIKLVSFNMTRRKFQPTNMSYIFHLYYEKLYPEANQTCIISHCSSIQLQKFE